MKKIVCILIACAMTGVVLAQTKYPGQDEGKKREVEFSQTFITKKPLIEQIGDMKYIPDVYNKAFILFKGGKDSLLEKMMHHLDTLVEYEEDGSTYYKTPVAIYTEVSISPFTLFTKQELKRQSKADRQKLVDLTEWKTYVLSVEDLTFVEDLTDEEYRKLFKLPPPVPKTDKPKVEQSTTKPKPKVITKPATKTGDRPTKGRRIRKS